jgi:hypothetical protein
MDSFDAEILQVDPSLVANGSADPSASSERDLKAPACQAALMSYKTAWVFSILFGSLVFIVSLAAAVSLVIFITRITADGMDVQSGVAALSALLTSGATVFLANKWRAANQNRRQSLKDVGTYCGTQVVDELAKLR